MIDISGDGPNNNGPPVVDRARCRAGEGHHHQRPADHGEGAVLLHDGYRQSRSLLRGLRDRRTRRVRRPIKERDKFKEAIRTKLVLEVAGRTPERPVIPAPASDRACHCTIGEQIWQRALGASGMPCVPMAVAGATVARSLNRATISTCGVWRNWSTGVTPSSL